jgi:addiction module RelE/StbE family toxin
MADTVVWSPRAIDDVNDIAAYIAQDSEAYSASVVRNILTKAKNLSISPFRGRIVPEFGDEHLREIFAYSYRMIYRVDEMKVTIAAVVHGKRLLDMAIEP